MVKQIMTSTLPQTLVVLQRDLEIGMEINKFGSPLVGKTQYVLEIESISIMISSNTDDDGVSNHIKIDVSIPARTGL